MVQSLTKVLEIKPGQFAATGIAGGISADATIK